MSPQTDRFVYHLVCFSAGDDVERCVRRHLIEDCSADAPYIIRLNKRSFFDMVLDDQTGVDVLCTQRPNISCTSLLGDREWARQ